MSHPVTAVEHFSAMSFSQFFRVSIVPWVKIRLIIATTMCHFRFVLMVYVFYFWRLFRSWMWHSLRTNLLLARKDIRLINHHYSYGYIFIRSRSPLRHILDFQHRLRALRQDDPLFWSQGCWMKWYSWEKTYALKSPFFFPLEPWILSLPCIRFTWECWTWAWW